MMRADCDDYAAIFCRDTPLLDTRAPLEFAKGTMPGSVNLPLLNDDERAQVGTCYKQHGQEAAIRLGHRLVCGAVKAQRLAAWTAFVRTHPDGYLYCWRGGQRSAIVQAWLHEAGYPYPRIVGGYKAMRQFLIAAQTRILADTPLLVLAGRTGCAKTALLHQLANSIDLEGIAQHRGSSFGKRPTGQPVQVDFENRLAVALLRQHHAMPQRTIVLEDESKLIGCRALPPEWCHAMRDAPRVLIEADLDTRIEHSFHNYILEKHSEWRTVLDDDAAAFNAFAADLQRSLDNIRKRLGGLRHQQLSALLQQALREHQDGNPDLHRAWIRTLLTDYYDPMYDHQLRLKSPHILFRGNFDAVRDYLLTQT